MLQFSSCRHSEVLRLYSWCIGILVCLLKISSYLKWCSKAWLRAACDSHNHHAHTKSGCDLKFWTSVAQCLKTWFQDWSYYSLEVMNKNLATVWNHPFSQILSLNLMIVQGTWCMNPCTTCVYNNSPFFDINFLFLGDWRKFLLVHVFLTMTVEKFRI